MTESNAVESLLPEGWYSDPASASMQRWWTGTDWTDHVRYAEKPRLHAVTAPTPEPSPAPQFAPIVATPPSHALGSGLDDFYVPMRGSSRSSSSSYMPTKRASLAAGGLWLLVVASVGIALGVTLWILLPR